MTHEVLPYVVDVASPDASRDDVGRMRWQLALLPEMCCCIFSCTFDANQVAKASQDSLSIHGGPMIRSRTKKMKEALNGLIEHISNSDFVQDYNMPEFSIQEGLCFVNVIQAS